jgi:hypothetical protein
VCVLSCEWTAKAFSYMNSKQLLLTVRFCYLLLLFTSCFPKASPTQK